MIQEIRFYIFIFFITTQINKKEKFPCLTSMAMLRRACLEKISEKNSVSFIRWTNQTHSGL